MERFDTPHPVVPAQVLIFSVPPTRIVIVIPGLKVGLASISALLYGNRACGVSGMPNVTPLGLPNHSRLKPTDVLHQSRGTVAKFSSILRAGRGSFVPMYPAKARGCRTAQFGTPSSTPGTWMFGSAAAWPIPVHASRHAVATATVPCRSRPRRRVAVRRPVVEHLIGGPFVVPPVDK